MEYYSAIKKNTFESVLMRWMKLEPIIQNEVSQKEKTPIQYAAAAAAAKLLQSFPTLCDPIDGSPPGSPVPGILQARILEWVAISFSRGSFQPKDQSITLLLLLLLLSRFSRVQLCATP